MTRRAQAALEPAVRGYAAEVVGYPIDRVTAVQRFDSGNRHAVFRVSFLDAASRQRSVVVRVSHGADDHEQLQALRESTVLAVTAGVAAPALHDFRPAGRWFDTPAMCIAFVPGRSRQLTSVSTQDMTRLAATLRWVHDRPTEQLERHLPNAGTIAAYAEQRARSILSGVAWVRDPLPADLQVRLGAAAEVLEQRARALEQTASFHVDAPLALLHGDPAADNILWSPDPVLIDWEYARLGDPADEIAYLFDQNEIGPSQRTAFWAGYGGDHAAAIAQRAGWWEPLTLLGSTLWWVERWIRRTGADVAGRPDQQVAREPAYYLDRIIRRVDRLDGLLTLG